MKPTMMIAILALKLYLGNKRLEMNVRKMININKKIAYFQYRYKTHLIIILRKHKPKNIIWSNKIGSILHNRKIELLNTEYHKVQISQNLTIIDYLIQYVKENNRNYEILVPMNYMRLRKRIYLLYELIGKMVKVRQKNIEKKWSRVA